MQSQADANDQNFSALRRVNETGYSLLFDIEVLLRELIAQALFDTYGQQWTKQGLPPDLQQKIRDGLSYERSIKWHKAVLHHPLYYVDFPDLKKIIIIGNNWRAIFDPIFAHKGNLDAGLSEVEVIRNKVAHNRFLTDTDLTILAGTYAKIIASIPLNMLCDAKRAALNLTPIAEDLLSRILLMPPGSRLIVYDIFLTSFAGTNQTWMIWDEPDQKSSLKKLETTLDSLKRRGEEVGISMITQSFNVTVPSREIVTQRIHKIAKDQTATRVAGMLMRQVATVYIEEKDRDEAKRIAETAFAISPSRLTPEANNIGYLYLAIGEHEEARRWFEAAQQYDVEKQDAQLVDYNFGVLSAMASNLPNALRHFRSATKADDSDASCVYRVQRNNAGLVFDEVFQPGSISEMAHKAIEAIEGVISTET